MSYNLINLCTFNENFSDILLNCTLWEDYATKFIQYNSDKKRGWPVIVMLKYAKIKEEGNSLFFPCKTHMQYIYITAIL